MLENRQLIPPISDQHIIKKLVRHYSREIRIATFTRGIQDIASFELLLREFMAVQGNGPATPQQTKTAVKDEYSEPVHGEHTAGKGKGRNQNKPAWRESATHVDYHSDRGQSKQASTQRQHYVPEAIPSTSKAQGNNEPTAKHSKN